MQAFFRYINLLEQCPALGYWDIGKADIMDGTDGLRFDLLVIQSFEKKSGKIILRQKAAGICWIICLDGAVRQRSATQHSMLAAHTAQIRFREAVEDVWEVVSEKPSCILIIFLPKNLLSNWLQAHHVLNWKMTLNDAISQYFQQKVTLDVPFGMELCMRKLLTARDHPLLPEQAATLEAHLLSLLEQFVLHHVSYPVNSMPNDEERVLALVSKYMQHFDAPISASFLMQQTGLNQVRLQKVFRTLFGQTVGVFIMTLRIEKAKELLVVSNDSILSVGMQVGFSSLSYFSRVFKQKVGVEPTVFRREGRAGILRSGSGKHVA